MLANATRRIRKALTLATGVMVRSEATCRQAQRDADIIAIILAESAAQRQREQDRAAALAACPAMVDACRAVLRMELRQRACEGDAFALAALRMMAC